MPSSDLLLFYGIVDEQNRNEAVTFYFNLDQDDPLLADKESLLASIGYPFLFFFFFFINFYLFYLFYCSFIYLNFYFIVVLFIFIYLFYFSYLILLFILIFFINKLKRNVKKGKHCICQSNNNQLIK